MATQRFESSVIAVSWIPSEAITGPSKIPFEFGVTHYDEVPPDHLEDLEALRTTDRFREANELRAFIECRTRNTQCDANRNCRGRRYPAHCKLDQCVNNRRKRDL